MANERDLTLGERAVVALVVEAKSNTEIAKELSVSTGTVKRYLTVIQMKWQVPNRVAIAVKAVRDGVVQ